MTTNSAEQPVPPGGPRPSVDELFPDSEPVRSADDLARQGVFDEGEVEEFLADPYAMRRADLAVVAGLGRRMTPGSRPAAWSASWRWRP